MFLSKIHHIAVICSDYEKSKDFYVNILGLTVLKETYRAERDSYKLDLMVGGEYQMSSSPFQTLQKGLLHQKQEGCVILPLKLMI